MCISVLGYSKSPGQDLQFEWWSLADTNERNWCFHSSSNLKQKKKEGFPYDAVTFVEAPFPSQGAEH